MDTRKLTLSFLSVFLCMPAITSNESLAGDKEAHITREEPFFVGRYNYVHEEKERLNSDPPITSLQKDNAVQNTVELNENIILHEKKARHYKAKSSQKRSFEDRLLEKIPYGDDLKYMWNIVDGDVDLHVVGLRADRRNKGIKYKTNTIPFIGDVSDLDLKFKAGDTTEFSFESRALPFTGNIEGFRLKGSAGTDGSKIYASYTIPFD